MVVFSRRKRFLFNAGDYFLRCLFKETGGSKGGGRERADLPLSVLLWL